MAGAPDDRQHPAAEPHRQSAPRRWVGFEDEGRVRFATGKVEIGQGIVTALAQIAAEELDVAPERVRIISGDTGSEPVGEVHHRQRHDRGGRCVVAPGLRRGARAVRASTSPRSSAATPPSWRSAMARFLRGGRETGLDYWSLARDVDLARPATGRAPTKLPSTIGWSAAACRGSTCRTRSRAAAFIHDIIPHNVLHARMLRRPWRGARLAGSTRRRSGAPPDGADRDPARRRSRRVHGRRRDGGDAGASRREAAPVGGRQPARPRHGRAGPADGRAGARPGDRDRGGAARKATASSRRAIRARSSPTARSARPARSPNSATARSRCGRTARVSSCCATGSRARSGWSRPASR